MNSDIMSQNNIFGVIFGSLDSQRASERKGQNFDWKAYSVKNVCGFGIGNPGLPMPSLLDLITLFCQMSYPPLRTPWDSTFLSPFISAPSSLSLYFSAPPALLLLFTLHAQLQTLSWFGWLHCLHLNFILFLLFLFYFVYKTNPYSNSRWFLPNLTQPYG